MTRIDNSRDTIMQVCMMVQKLMDMPGVLTPECERQWTKLRQGLEGVASVIDMSAPATPERPQRTFGVLPNICFKGVGIYSDSATITLGWPPPSEACVTDETGARWYVTDALKIGVSYSSMYSSTITDPSIMQRLTHTTLSYDIGMKIMALFRSAPFCMLYETPEQAANRDAIELAAAKVSAIQHHVAHCKERQTIKVGQSRWLRSYDTVAAAINADPGMYQVRVHVSRYASRNFEVYIGDPRGAIIRRM
jgi:hypothetical protein